MGDLAQLDAADGKVLWNKNLVKEYKTEPPVWGYAAHPLVDGDLLYSPGRAATAAPWSHSTRTRAREVEGARRASRGRLQPADDLRNRRQAAVDHLAVRGDLRSRPGHGQGTLEARISAGRAHAASGRVNIVTVKKTDEMLFISTFYHGPMMVESGRRKSRATVVWKGKSNTPVLPDGARHDGFAGLQGRIRLRRRRLGRVALL